MADTFLAVSILELEIARLLANAGVEVDAVRLILPAGTHGDVRLVAQVGERMAWVDIANSIFAAGEHVFELVVQPAVAQFIEELKVA